MRHGAIPSLLLDPLCEGGIDVARVVLVILKVIHGHGIIVVNRECDSVVVESIPSRHAPQRVEFVTLSLRKKK